MIVFDSHLHLNHADFHGRESQTWQDANEAGVCEGVVVGYDIESSARAIRLAETLEGLYAGVGVSPHDILKAPDDYLEQLKTMANHPRVVAIGEAGLEYHYPAGPKEMQIQQFLRQAELAERVQKPLIIHLREADEDFLRLLKTFPASSAILHCFTASEDVMNAAVERGFYISFSGIVTFKNAKSLHELAAKVPDANLLVETDAPYLAPVPFRGKICKPEMIIETVKKIAQIREERGEDIAHLTCRNAQTVFGLSTRSNSK
ncbi:MAG: TatD family deoxyribonuclease [Candidatus Omnitrophota bacterium]|jgi:TatD DNase family protein|nr:MAG: TatD family deoxyribonuclease [Candidatus Omnitrophota bacterium]